MTLTGMPQLVVELGLGYGPFQVSSLVWTDVSAYVQNVSIRRGRNYELDAFEAGTADVLFQNDTGLFDPMNSAGTYYGKLLPNCPIRISAIWNSTTYVLFRGFVERWPPKRYGGKYHSQTQVTCVDAFGLFANYRFPLVDDGIGGGVKAIAYYTQGLNSAYAGGDSFFGTDEAVRVYALCNIVEWSSGPPGAFRDYVLDVYYTNANGTANRLGQLKCNHRFHSVHAHHVGRRKHHGHRIARPGHYDARHSRAQHWRHEIDLKLQGNDTVHSIQNVVWKSGTFSGKNANFTFYGERALIPRTTSDIQLQRALAYLGFPASLQNIKRAGRFTQLPDSPWDTTLADVVRQIQETELGQIYPDRSGIVQFEDRDWRLNNWSANSWHDGAGTGNFVYAECEPSYDNERVATAWEVTRLSQGSNDTPVMQTAVNTSSRDQYGTIKGQRTTAVQTDGEALKQAQYLLGFTQSPQYRMQRLTIRPRKDPTNLWPSVLALDVSTGMTVKQYPPNGPASSYLVSSDQWVEHVSHTITPDDWVTDLETSPRLNLAFPT